MFSCFPLIAYAKTIHVPSEKPNIQAGINAAVDGDTVLVAPGTYIGTGNRDIDFNGKAIVVMSEDGPENTIIFCQSKGLGFYFHNTEDLDSEVNGFMIARGYSGYGGGMRIWSSSPTIKNCIFFKNESVDRGGGINGICTSTYILNCYFFRNNVNYSGGGNRI
jgi:hypothetical protein